MKNKYLAPRLIALMIVASCSKNTQDLPVANAGQTEKVKIPRNNDGRLMSSTSEPTVTQTVYTIIAQSKEGLSSSDISLDASFFDDLGFDSLDFVEMLMDIEDEFYISIPDYEAEKIKYVAQLIAYVMDQLPTVTGTYGGNGDGGDGGFGGFGGFGGGTGSGSGYGGGGTGGSGYGGGSGSGGGGTGGTTPPPTVIVEDMEITQTNNLNLDDGLEGPSEPDSLSEYNPSYETRFTPISYGRAAKLRKETYNNGTSYIIAITQLRIWAIPEVSTRIDKYGRTIIRHAKAIDQLSNAVILQGQQMGLINWNFDLLLTYTCPKVPSYFRQTHTYKIFQEKVTPYSPIFL